MKINYKNRPELLSFDSEKFDFRMSNEVFEYSEDIKEISKYFKSLNLKKKIISNTVIEKALSTDVLPKLLNIESNDFKNSGIIIRNNTTYFFDFKPSGINFFLFVDGILISFISSELNINASITSYSNELIKKELSGVFGITKFLEYAKIETKYLEPKKKLKEFGCKYFNETDSEIEIINSTWFTNLIKSDAFKVRGHFRLQPKKINGEWTKELIWINEFKKEGYISKARKLNYT